MWDTACYGVGRTGLEQISVHVLYPYGWRMAENIIGRGQIRWLWQMLTKRTEKVLDGKRKKEK